MKKPRFLGDKHVDVFKSQVSDCKVRSKKTAKNYLNKPLSRKQKKNIVAVILFIIATIAFGLIVGKPLMQFFKDPAGFQSYAQQQPIAAAFALVFIMMLQIVIAVIPGEPVQLAAGYSFGALWGTVLALAGSAVGSAVVFLLVKRYGRSLVDIFFSQEKLDEVGFLNDSKRLNTLVFILMFIPGTPKDLITYVVGLTPMKLRTWLLISIPARTPALLASTVAGSSFGSGDKLLTIVILLITGLLACLGIVYYAFLTKQARIQKDMDRMHEHYKQVRSNAQAANRAASNSSKTQTLESNSSQTERMKLSE